MTQTQSDRLKDVQRQYAEMEHHTATLQQAQQAAEKAAWVAENNYRSRTRHHCLELLPVEASGCGL